VTIDRVYNIKTQLKLIGLFSLPYSII